MTFEKEWRTFYPVTVCHGDGKEARGLIVRDILMPEATGLVLKISYDKFGHTQSVNVLWELTGEEQWCPLITGDAGWDLEVFL